MRKRVMFRAAAMFVVVCLAGMHLELQAAAAPAPEPRQQTAAAAAPQTSESSDGRSGRHFLKWIVIGGAAVVAVLVFLSNRDQPVVTVGSPTVGSPQ